MATTTDADVVAAEQHHHDRARAALAAMRARTSRVIDPGPVAAADRRVVAANAVREPWSESAGRTRDVARRGGGLVESVRRAASWKRMAAVATLVLRKSHHRSAAAGGRGAEDTGGVACPVAVAVWGSGDRTQGCASWTRRSQRGAMKTRRPTRRTRRCGVARSRSGTMVRPDGSSRRQPTVGVR